MQKSKIVLILIICLLVISGCKDKNTDAYKFKKEYESLNLTKSSSGKTIRELNIDENNPFVYKTEDDIVNAINNKETFIVYFGFPSCPWCRSVLPTLIDVSKEYSINKIYYVNVEDIRDAYALNDKNEPVKAKEGTSGYNKLLELLKDKLADYNLTTEDGNTISTNEKRIYAPNIVGVIDGKVIDVVTGISSLQTDGYMELTSEMQQETYDIFVSVIKEVSEALNSCDISGC